MIEFITLIALLCSQPGVGHGDGRSASLFIRNDAFLAQSSCTKRLFKACTEKHKVMGHLLPKAASCLVENL